MGCFRVLLALVLLVLAAGFGLCGLILTNFGNASDHLFGLIMIGLAVAALVGCWSQFSKGVRQSPPRDDKPGE